MREVINIHKPLFTRGRHLSFTDAGCEWTAVYLPHDFNADAPYVAEGPWPYQQGYIKSRSDGTYRCTFINNEDNPVVYLLADGIYRDCEIYINGTHAGGSPYGYIPMTLDITELTKPGENQLLIYVNNQNERDDRWYSGAGIYRSLSLLFAPGAHFVPDGVAVRSKLRPDGTAEVEISAELAGAAPGMTVGAELIGNSGPEASAAAQVLDGRAFIRFSLAEPSLWAPENPNLYHAKLTLYENGAVIDNITEAFGVRTIKFDVNAGFLVNGKPTLLCGVNLHHDSGCLGAAFYTEVWRERLATLKAFGLNAVRTSHNPQAREFYNLCDELGIFVVDELYDKWDEGSYNAHFWAWYERDVAAWVRRDRNHPSVILYSVGNEVACQGFPALFDPLDKLVSAVKGIDDTRPVSFAMHPYGWPDEIEALTPDEKAEWTAKIAEHVDILLCNYQEQWYEKYHKTAPDKCMLGSEIYQWYTSTDDTSEYVEKHPWQYIHELPYAPGGFYWAGIDYRGESLEPPARGWSSDLLDITGFPKPQAHLARAYWTETPMAAAALSVPESALPPSFERKGWSFPPCVPHLDMLPEDGPATILVFTNCEAASLWQKGKKVAQRPVRAIGRCLFFEASLDKDEDLLVIGENGGEEAARFVLSPYGKPAGLSLTASKTELDSGNPADVSVLRVQLVDDKGRACAQNGGELSIALSGLTLLGADNGDMGARRSHPAQKLPLFNGRAVIFVRGYKSGLGEVSISFGALTESISITII